MGVLPVLHGRDVPEQDPKEKLQHDKAELVHGAPDRLVPRRLQHIRCGLEVLALAALRLPPRSWRSVHLQEGVDLPAQGVGPGLLLGALGANSPPYSTVLRASKADVQCPLYGSLCTWRSYR